MRTIVFKQVARKLICSQRAGLLKVPVGMLAARVQEVIKLAASLGFGFAGPVLGTRLAPHLMAYGTYRVPFFDHVYNGQLSCWSDGAVALDMVSGGKKVFGIRIDKDGRITQQPDLISPLTASGTIGELLARVEKCVTARHAGNIPEKIDKVYILTTTGRMMCRISTGKSQAEAAQDAVETKKLITTLSLKGLLKGYVYVCCGRIQSPGATAQRETLIFSAFAAKNKRVRVYELKKVGGCRAVSRFVMAIGRQ
jgi:hypothetical protein